MIFANILGFFLTKCPNFFGIAHLTCKCRLKLPSILKIIEMNGGFLIDFPISTLSLTKVVSVFSLFSPLVDQG